MKSPQKNRKSPKKQVSSQVRKSPKKSLVKKLKKSKSIRGSKFLGQGNFSCAFSPPLGSKDKNLLGKVMFEEIAEQEKKLAEEKKKHEEERLDYFADDFVGIQVRQIHRIE